MRRFGLLLLGLMVAASSAIWFVATRPAPLVSLPATIDQSRPLTRPVQGVVPPTRPNNRDGTALASSSLESTKAISLLTDESEALARIRLLSTSMEPGQVSELASYLEHPLAEVRKHARLGLLLLGDTNAIPFLENAAVKSELEGRGQEASFSREAIHLLRTQASEKPLLGPRPSLAEHERVLNEEKKIFAQSEASQSLQVGGAGAKNK